MDKIAKFLDAKSLLRLQLTCKTLFKKGATAQHLVTISSDTAKYESIWYLYQSVSGEIRLKFFSESLILSEEQFKATNFRFQAGILRIAGNLTPEVCDYIAECLHGRGTVRHLDLDGFTTTLDSFRFNKFLQDYHISELSVATLPWDCFYQPCVQKLEKLQHDRYFPVPLDYFLFSATHSCRLAFRQLDFDFDHLNLLLKKWANGRTTIEDLIFKMSLWRNIYEKKAFDGWVIVNGKEEISFERPLVIRDGPYRKYRLLRVDEATLYISYIDGHFRLSASGYPDCSSSTDADHNGGGSPDANHNGGQNYFDSHCDAYEWDSRGYGEW